MLVTVSLIILQNVSCTSNFRQIEKKILDSIIGDTKAYDSRIRPSGVNKTVLMDSEVVLTDGPCLVRVNIFLRSISKISDLDMEYSVQITFREQWIDERLQYDDMKGQIKFLVQTDPSKIWKPDLFFSNEKEGHFHDIIMPNVLLRIYPNGEVLYSIRLSLVLACPMDLKYYPLDIQTCSIRMASWEYSCLMVNLIFKREFSYYLIQIYIPCCMLVIVSWVSFWLDPNAIPARVSLGVTTLLTMATQISGINASLPPVSYTKAIDVWTGVCLTFVFGALLEFALVNYASRSDAHRAAAMHHALGYGQRRWDAEGNITDDGMPPAGYNLKSLVLGAGGRRTPNGGSISCQIHEDNLKSRNCLKNWLSKFPTRSKRIDVISRIFFPLMFALFNLVYWTTYLFRDDLAQTYS
ncbi:Glutamate-gated chloride channel [Halotydeus destructor]|nr:Glutamate-gated chloride channel [Halotydeus destructor]